MAKRGTKSYNYPSHADERRILAARQQQVEQEERPMKKTLWRKKDNYRLAKKFP
jgi:hypothetical protein